MSIELRETEYHRGKAYEVWRDGAKIGVVRHCFPTFERGPRGRTWVTRRWTAKQPYWEWLRDGQWHSRLFTETRKRAVERLVEDVDRK